MIGGSIGMNNVSRNGRGTSGSAKSVALVLFFISATIYGVGALVILDLTIRLGDAHVISYVFGVALAVVFLFVGLFISLLASLFIYRLCISMDRTESMMRHMVTHRPAQPQLPARRQPPHIDTFND